MTVEEAAAEIRELAAVRPRGGGTKLGWSAAGEDAVDFDTRRLNRILEHNEGDFTAVLEAGVPLVEAQAKFAAAGQMLALDPPLGEGDAATIGGVIATNDSGPLRHRYGGVRDLVVGMTVVLSDGTIAKSGGKVIKNVAGYDLAKLFAGSFGTLGLIGRVAVRLHPAPARTATLTGASDDPREACGGRAPARGAAARGGLASTSAGSATPAGSACASAARPRSSAPRRPASTSSSTRSPSTRTTRSSGRCGVPCSARRTGSWSRSQAAPPTSRA